MLSALIAGLALGGVYALMSGGLMVTYLSSGVMNFAYAAMAYFVARLYYFLYVQHGWNLFAAAAISILVVGSVFGIAAWYALFRFVRLASHLVKIVVTVGLAVSVPAVTVLIFGNVPITDPPGLAPQPVATWHIFGSTVTADEVIVYGCALLILGGGAAILRWTNAGLLVRAVVDSSAMASLTGVRPGRVAVSVWAASTFAAGLAGVLAAPIIGLSADSFTVLLAAGLAAAVAARLRSIGIAALAALLMGVATEVVERYLPSTSQLVADIVPSIPFLFLVAFLLYWIARSKDLGETQTIGGFLDRAIAPQGGSELALARAVDVARGSSRRALPTGSGLVAVLVLAGLLDFCVQGIWLSMAGLGTAYAVALLSYTISAGEGGMIWLCQITFAGLGAVAAAELATNHGWPVLVAMVVAGVGCSAVGAIIGLLTIRLGNLYVALVTLTFGLLIDNLLFQWAPISNYGAGLALSRPGFATGDRAFALFALAVFALVSFGFSNGRRSTSGLAIRAVRWSEPLASTMGVGVVRSKVILAAISAGVAGIGGVLLAMYALAAVPGNFSTLTGLTWLAILVTVGIRNSGPALLAGLSLAFIPELFTVYLPSAWGNVPPALFGLGAILVARYPEGIVAVNFRQLASLFTRRQSAICVDAADQRLGQDSETAGDKEKTIRISGNQATNVPHARESL